MRRIASLFLVSLAAGALASAAAAQSPNVLIVITDDQRATGTLRVMPDTRRYFKLEGRRFTNAFATTPLCCPSRSTLFTGRYAHNTGIRANGQATMLDMRTIFPRLLQEAGYRTALVGKFLTGWPRDTPPPYFDRWALGGGYFDRSFNVDGVFETREGYSTTLIGGFAAQFLESFEATDSSPWLLYVAPHAPHHPWIPEPRYADAPVGRWNGNPAVREEDRSDKPPYVRSVEYTLEQGRTVRRQQLRTLMSVDDMVEVIFGKLAELGETQDTLAIFTSDNGFLWADHRLGGARNTAGQKRVPYTPSVEVPFLARWPGHIEPGTRDSRLTGNVDIAPTVLEAAGVAPDPTGPPLDGRSFLTSAPRERIVLEYWRERWIPTWASLRTPTYQYIENYADDDVTPTFFEHYDLVSDPWQLENVLYDVDAVNDPDVPALSAQLASDRACAGTSGPSACP